MDFPNEDELYEVLEQVKVVFQKTDPEDIGETFGRLVGCVVGPFVRGYLEPAVGEQRAFEIGSDLLMSMVDVYNEKMRDVMFDIRNRN